MELSDWVLLFFLAALLFGWTGIAIVLLAVLCFYVFKRIEN